MTAFLRSVKFRLTVWYAFVLTVFLTIFAFLMHAELEKALYLDVDRNLSQQAAAIEKALSGHLSHLFRSSSALPPLMNAGTLQQGIRPELSLLLRESLKDWERTTQSLRRATLMIRVLVYDHSVVISNLKGWEKEIIYPDFERDSVFMEKGQSFQTIHFQKKPVRLYYHTIAYEGRPLYVVQIGYSLQEVESTLSRLRFIILIWIPVAVAAAGVAGWFLSRRSLRPIDSMIREARQITAAYLQGRLPRTQTGDEIDRLAATLNEMMDRIASSTQAVREFSVDVSHELKTPLAIIRGEIDLALRKSRSAEDLMQTLKIIEDEVNGLIRLVDDLMLLVRSDSHQLRFEKKKISLKDILENVVARLQDRAGSKQLALSLKADADVEVYGDEIYLKRLFSNLVDNGLKFTPAGGWVRLSLTRDGGAALIQVSDNGMGIETEIQEKVFSRFYRSDQARAHEGSGLGLNIAKAICDAHGGSLHIQSRPQTGTTVTVSLPLSPKIPN